MAGGLRLVASDHDSSNYRMSFRPLAIRVAGIVDRRTDDVTGPAVLMSWNGRFASSREQRSFPTPIIDASDLVAAPPFIDSHSHLTLSGRPGDEEPRSDSDTLITAEKALQTLLSHGVTGVRVLGEPTEVDLKIRAEQGFANRPRMWCAGSAIGASRLPEEHPLHDPRWVNLPIAQQVELNLGKAVNWIKLYGTRESSADNPTERLLSRDEIYDAVGRAKRAGIPVAVHAHGGDVVDDCLEAGVTTIEHGRFVTEAQLLRMARQGVTLCCTIGVNLHKQGLVEQAPSNWEKCCPQPLAAALAAGVTVILGSDAAPGGIPFEIEAASIYGMRKVDARIASSTTPLRVMGLGSMSGSLLPGTNADFILEVVDATSGRGGRVVVATFVEGRLVWLDSTRLDAAHELRSILDRDDDDA